MAKRILVWCLLAATSFAAEVVPVVNVNGTRYRDVKFGPVNQEQIVLFHSHGVVTVPVASLPAEYQQRFTPKPGPGAVPVPQELNDAPRSVATITPPRPAEPDPASILAAMRTKKPEPVTTGGRGMNDWAVYNRDRANLMLLDGRLVDKSELTTLVGFLAKERTQVNDGKTTYYGAALDLAERKNQDDNIAAAMELRPSLWQRTDDRVLLVNHKPMSLLGALMKVYVVEIDPIADWRAFLVATDPSFEEWKRLSRK